YAPARAHQMPGNDPLSYSVTSVYRGEKHARCPMASAVLEVPRMKKIVSKKLQLRSTTIATLTGSGLRNVQGGTNDDGAGGTGDDTTTGGTWGPSEKAGVRSQNDGNTNPQHCDIPLTTC